MGDVTQLRYAGFWRRFAAFWLDFLALIPLFLFALVGARSSHFFQLYYAIFVAAYSIFYNVYLVRRYGGTPGKLILDMRIRKVDGSAIGYREAVLRFLPEFLLWMIASIGMLLPLFEIIDPAFEQLGFFDRQDRLTELRPAWVHYVEISTQIWAWGEFVIMLTNRKRRALHDFIAGTVVIVRQKPATETVTA